MKKRHKQPACLNCHRPLTEKDNFCPSCGQENTNSKHGINILFHDFFSNYFSFDSKLTRSTIPFLVKPGYLTNRYNEGKRTGYVHPLRLYLIISFLFSLSLAFLIDKAVDEKKLFLFSETFKKMDSKKADEAKDNYEMPNFKVKVAGKYVIPPADSTQQLVAADTTKSALTEPEEPEIKDLLRDESLSDDDVLKKMKWENEGPLYRIFVHQGRKVLQKDMDVFLPYVLKNLSIMMFLLLPLFAFYLYVLFGRKERYYISHAIHALHLHSFSFMIITLLILQLIFGDLSGASGPLILIGFIIVTLYAFFSVKRVYKQSWLRTFLKFNVLGIFYFLTLSFGIVLELLISFALF